MPGQRVPAPFEVDLHAIMALPVAEREEEFARAAVLKRVLDENPLWRYLPHEGELQWKREEFAKLRQAHGDGVSVPPHLQITGREQRGQKAFHEIDTPYGAFMAGNRAGKSHAGVADDAIQTLPPEFLPPWLLPYKRWGFEDEVYVRVIGPDLANWLAKVMLPKIRKLLPAAALWKGSFDRAYDGRERKLRFANGSWWDFLTHDMELDAFAGADLDRAHFDEEPEGEPGRERYEETLGRLVDRDGEVRWTLTPLLGLSFATQELMVDEEPRWDEECRVVMGDIDHNPHLSDEGRRRFLARLAKDPLRLQARKSGRPVHFAGRIYDEFRDDEHIVPDRDPPRAQTPAGPGALIVPLYASIDPGINKDHQMALVMAFVEQLSDGRELLEIFHTHKFANGVVADMATHFHSVLAALDARTRWNIIDPAAQNRNAVTGRSIQWEFQQHKVQTILGQNARIAGFNAVKERLAPKDPAGNLLPPTLVVQASCTDLIDEIKTYRWKKPKGQRQDAPRAEPIKINDDLVDAMRYLVMSLPQKGRHVDESDLDQSPPAVAFRNSLKRIGRRKRQRVGGYV